MSETFTKQQGKRRVITVSLTLLLASLTAYVTPAREGREKPSGQLTPCPKSPNCVSTMSSDPKRAMPPLPYIGASNESLDRLARILKDMKRCKILTTSHPYVHAEFRSAVFGFVDDVEFLFDDKKKQIHFRSASRTGYYDFGVNQKRMKKITKLYLQGIPNQ